MTSENFRPMHLTDRHEQAAVLVAADTMNDTDIAKQVSISDRQLRTWKLHPTFQARVEYHRQLWRDQLATEGIANLQNRVDALNERWRLMRQVVEARAAALADEAPGGDTGLLVRTEKQIGAGEKAVRITEYAVDTGLLRELRAHEEQAAKELGQWEDKQRVTGEMIVREYIGIDPEAV